LATRSNLFKSFLLVLIFGFIFSNVQDTYAEEPENEAYYVVQAGDSLYGIANRFHIPIEDLIAENPSAAELGLFAGDSLIIPGIDWVSGQLDFNFIELDKITLRSISRQFNMDVDLISRLNGISSLNQYIMGRELLLPQKNEISSSKLIAFSPEDTATEIAAMNFENRWKLISENDLSGSWDLVSGKPLIVDSDPNSEVSIIPENIHFFETFPEEVYQGEIFFNYIKSNQEIKSIEGSFGDYELDYYLGDSGVYLSLQGIEVILDPGFYPFQFWVEWENGDIFAYEYLLPVLLGDYRYEILIVDEDLTGIDVGLEERELLQTAMSSTSQTMLWNDKFAYPTSNPDYVTSLFGTRRSLNYSAYDYFHGGIDYGADTGQDIYAAADGVVVFAGEMPIRGNATMIDHGLGVFSLYGHQSQFLVEVGDIITREQLIGLIGSTGRSTGPHVHWEVWVNGIQTNPIKWVSLDYPYMVEIP
jgi:murein DD-endopeptidase MepM/ murein hydrolase activator NlpD